MGLCLRSILHSRKTQEFPGWEDWGFEFGKERALEWLGDVWTRADREGVDMMSYLDEVDYPPVTLSKEFDQWIYKESLVSVSAVVMRGLSGARS